MRRKRHERTDEQWAQLEPLLPPPPRTGRTHLDHRTVLNGMRWILKTGAPWRDVPARYGTWETVYRRFQRWQKSGGWDRIFQQLQRIKDRDGQVDWEVHYIDGSTVRAHQHAAGANKVT